MKEKYQLKESWFRRPLCNMEKNTVILGIEVYDDLKKSQEQFNHIKDGGVIIYAGGLHYTSERLMTKDESVKELADKLRDANIKISTLEENEREIIESKNKEVSSLTSLTNDAFKHFAEMSWFEFKKWKKKYKHKAL